MLERDRTVRRWPVGIACEEGVLKPLERAVGLELAGAVLIVFDRDDDFCLVACWDVLLE